MAGIDAELIVMPTLVLCVRRLATFIEFILGLAKAIWEIVEQLVLGLGRLRTDCL